jgi:hypothetical protein
MGVSLWANGKDSPKEFQLERGLAADVVWMRNPGAIPGLKTVVLNNTLEIISNDTNLVPGRAP